MYSHQPRHQPQEDLPWLTQQDFRALAKHAADVLREERLGLLDGSDVNPEHHASEKDGVCGK